LRTRGLGGLLGRPIRSTRCALACRRRRLGLPADLRLGRCGALGELAHDLLEALAGLRHPVPHARISGRRRRGGDATRLRLCPRCPAAALAELLHQRPVLAIGVVEPPARNRPGPTAVGRSGRGLLHLGLGQTVLLQHLAELAGCGLGQVLGARTQPLGLERAVRRLGPSRGERAAHRERRHRRNAQESSLHDSFASPDKTKVQIFPIFAAECCDAPAGARPKLNQVATPSQTRDLCALAGLPEVCHGRHAAPVWPPSALRFTARRPSPCPGRGAGCKVWTTAAQEEGSKCRKHTRPARRASAASATSASTAARTSAPTPLTPVPRASSGPSWPLTASASSTAAAD